MSIEYRRYDYVEFQRAINAGEITFEGIIQMFDNPNKLCLLYDTYSASPVESLAATTDTKGDSVMVSFWNSCLVIVDKTGSGTCAVSVEGRQKDGTWYILPSTTGGVLSNAMDTGAQTYIVQADLVGWYELRVTVASVVGAVSVTGTISRGN